MSKENLHNLIDDEIDLVSLSEDELNALQNDLNSLCSSVTNAKIEKKINVLKERAAAGEELLHFRTTPCIFSIDEWKEILENTAEDDFYIIAEYFDLYAPRKFGGELSFCTWKKREFPEVLASLRVWTEEDLWPIPLYDDILNETNEDEIRKIFCDNIGKGLDYQNHVFKGDNNSLIDSIKEVTQKAKIYFNGELYTG